MALTTQTRLQIIELRAEGLPFAKIAEEVKVSKQTAVDVVGESRDLSDISTDKLITLYLNTTKNLKEEVFTPKMETTTEQAETSRQREIFNKW